MYGLSLIAIGKNYFRTNCVTLNNRVHYASFAKPEEKYKHIWATDKLSI